MSLSCTFCTGCTGAATRSVRSSAGVCTGAAPGISRTVRSSAGAAGWAASTRTVWSTAGSCGAEGTGAPMVPPSAVSGSCAGLSGTPTGTGRMVPSSGTFLAGAGAGCRSAVPLVPGTGTASPPG